MDKTIYEIDFLLNEYNYELNKAREIYFDFRKKILPKKPIQELEDPATTVKFPNSRGLAYKWELNEIENSLVMIEIFGGKDSYARAEELPFDFNKPIESSYDRIERMKITIHNPNEKLEKRVDKVLFKYPGIRKEGNL